MRQIWLVILTVALAACAWAAEPLSLGLTLAGAYRLALANDARLAAIQEATHEL